MLLPLLLAASPVWSDQVRLVPSHAAVRLGTYALEQHQPDWNSRADKVARSNNEIEGADCSSQHESALGLIPFDASFIGVDEWMHYNPVDKNSCARHRACQERTGELTVHGGGSVVPRRTVLPDSFNAGIV